MRSILALLLLARLAAAEPEFPLTEDSKPQPNVPKGTLLKDNYAAQEGSVFPGTGREYQIYLPHGFDKTKPAPFMVFQDGVIYQAPVVFDNLIAKKDIPPLVGIFIKPGVVPAANDNALPRFNRSYEYDSVTDTYSRFLLDEFLPAIEAKHGIQLSADPNQAAIAGNSSGGICAFMAAWHRHDRFRRVFTGVGTYVGIRGADQLPVLVRKFEPKPLRVFLQSGTGDNNLYCGDWWMANQMMERSLTWAGYDVNHAWGEGGHNQKHASQVFPDALRWLWRDWQTDIEVKANPKGDSKWRGYEVVGEGGWEMVGGSYRFTGARALASNRSGEVLIIDEVRDFLHLMSSEGSLPTNALKVSGPICADWLPDGHIALGCRHPEKGTQIVKMDRNGRSSPLSGDHPLPAAVQSIAVDHKGIIFYAAADSAIWRITSTEPEALTVPWEGEHADPPCSRIVFCPDQTQILGIESGVSSFQIKEDRMIGSGQEFYLLENHEIAWPIGGLCVDTNGWLYVATSLGIQVLDQAGRVNFIIPTPKQPHDVCFGGKDLRELFIACGDESYKRPTKAKGVVSGQQAPIKPPPPKL